MCVARVGQLLPNSHEGRQPPANDSSNFEITRLVAIIHSSIFEISRLVTNWQPSINGKTGAVFFLEKKLSRLT